MPADTFFTFLIPASILITLLAAPYTKVEESFNIQATHDVLAYGIPYPWDKYAGLELRAHYDHLTFTGPVPRTLVGPLALAAASWPFIWLSNGLGGELGRQLIVRAVLGLFNAFCLLAFRASVSRSFGRIAGNWYVVFQASQFHVMFYASRTLPNIFAFGLTTLALRKLLPLAGRYPNSRTSKARYSTALTVLTISGIVFRSEIALLLACHTLYLFLSPRIRLPLLTIIPAGLFGAFIGLTLTVPIDTFFWRTYPPSPLWPELTGFLYNIYHNNAQNWGAQPWHFYFTSALPRLLFNPLLWQICLPFALLMPITRRPACDVLIPNLLFVAIYSFQPHKEWRFIIYIIPPLLAVASASASWIWTRRAKNFMYRVMSLALVASTLATFLASGGMLFVSRLNYPGGEALSRLHELAENESGVVRVHMDTLACMTGVTRFLEKRPPDLADGSWKQGEVFWVYDKTENQTTLLDPLFWEGVDYALAEDPKLVPGRWEVIDTVSGFAGIGLLRVREGLEGEKPSLGTLQSFVLSEGERWVQTAQDIWRQGWDEKDILWIQHSCSWIWQMSKSIMRSYITRGWWVEIKMDPRIRILKKEKEENVSWDSLADEGDCLGCKASSGSSQGHEQL